MGALVRSFCIRSSWVSLLVIWTIIPTNSGVFIYMLVKKTNILLIDCAQTTTPHLTKPQLSKMHESKRIRKPNTDWLLAHFKSAIFLVCISNYWKVSALPSKLSQINSYLSTSDIMISVTFAKSLRFCIKKP